MLDRFICLDFLKKLGHLGGQRITQMTWSFYFTVSLLLDFFIHYIIITGVYFILVLLIITTFAYRNIINLFSNIMIFILFFSFSFTPSFMIYVNLCVLRDTLILILQCCNNK